MDNLAVQIAEILDPQAWSGREKKSDVWRRTHSLKKARAILALVRSSLPPPPTEEQP